jgi:hypothetical protein
MRLSLFIFLFTLSCIAFSQQQGRVKYFDIIISLSATNTDNTVEEIKTLINGSTTGLIYEGYCKSQKCLILKANLLSFSSAVAVVSYLKVAFGNSILCSKDYTVKDFYKLCTFASESEYQYFKITYK